MNEVGALAALDCGTNSTRLLVVGPAGDVRAREMRITRLGEGVDAARRLRSDAVDRTLSVLRSYRALMDAHGVTQARLVATSAVRDAFNGEGFLRPAAEIVGVPAEVLSGEEEGFLSYLGATADLPPGGSAAVIIDIGGGSTELVTDVGDQLASVSLDIGCVRLTERFLHSDPPTAPEISDALAAIAAELDRAVSEVPGLADHGRARRLVGLAGTVSTLACLELGLPDYDRARIHQATVSADAVRTWCEVLGREPLALRARRPGLPEGRRDVIFGGALILRETMERLDLRECVVSEADILDGLVLSLATPPDEGPGVPRLP